MKSYEEICKEVFMFTVEYRMWLHSFKGVDFYDDYLDKYL